MFGHKLESLLSETTSDLRTSPSSKWPSLGIASGPRSAFSWMKRFTISESTYDIDKRYPHVTNANGFDKNKERTFDLYKFTR